MQKGVMTAALVAATTLTATPALARDGAAYVELDAGVMFVEDFDLDVNGVDNAGRLRPDSRDFGVKVDGADFGGIAGYDFGAFRLEGEASYKKIRNGRLAVGNLESRDARGTGEVFSLMANGMLDLGPDDGLQGFIGGGAGWAKVSHKIGGAGVSLDDSDSGFAWQLLAGIRAPLSDTMDVGLKYRFFNASNVDLVADSGADVSTRWRSHSIMGTFTFNFGGREVEAPPPPPPPPPAPVAPPPPPPQTKVCPDGTEVGMYQDCPIPPPPPPSPQGERG